MKKWRLYISSFISVLIVFHITYRLRVLLPTNVSWLMTVMHDWGTHYLGWYFYRNEPWHFPIGQITDYYYPVGTNVGFTDSIPLMAILLKPFSSLLPEDFQYFGIWLLSCNLLLAWFTIRLFRLFQVRDIYTAIAVIFLVSNPVLVYRGFHPALCAHWLLVASIYLYFLNPRVVRVDRILFYQFLLLFISSLVNPYLFFMVFGFTVFTPLKLYFYDNAINLKRLTAYLAVSVLIVLAAWYIVGMISFGKKETLQIEGGYGRLSMNLNALFNSLGWSSFFPKLDWVSNYQYEGFMYLGAGFYLLIILLLGYMLFRLFARKDRLFLFGRTWTIHGTSIVLLGILMVAFALFSITHVVTYNQRTLFKVHLPDSFILVGNIFRASGRFFWAPYYLIILFTLIAVARSSIRPIFRISILAAALFLQLYDIKQLLVFRQNMTYGSYIPPIDPSWSKLIRHFDKMVFYPPFQTDYLVHVDYQYFAYLAAQARKPINMGYVAREDTYGVNQYSDSLRRELGRSRISPKALYITTPASLAPFYPALESKKLLGGMLDGYYYLYSASLQNDGSLPAETDLGIKKTEFIKTGPIKPGGKLITYNLEKLEDDGPYLNVQGWAFCDTVLNKGDSIFLFLKSADSCYMGQMEIMERPDITAYFKAVDLADAGFNSVIFKDSVPGGAYHLGVAIKRKTGTWIYQMTDSVIQVDHSLR